MYDLVLALKFLSTQHIFLHHENNTQLFDTLQSSFSNLYPLSLFSLRHFVKLSSNFEMFFPFKIMYRKIPRRHFSSLLKICDNMGEWRSVKTSILACFMQCIHIYCVHPNILHIMMSRFYYNLSYIYYLLCMT